MGKEDPDEKRTYQIYGSRRYSDHKKIPRENDGIAEISRYIKRGDIRMANLETTVTDGDIALLLHFQEERG